MAKEVADETLKERRRRYYLKHRSKRIQSSKDKWKNNPEKVKEYQIRAERLIRNRRIKYQYGINIDEYDELVKRQNGLCAICGNKEENKNKKYLAIDHNHTTNTVRGLLCHKCNVALGLFNDSVDVLLKAVNYLKKTSE